MTDFMILLQVLVAASLFFVWVVRYDNIVEEFKSYGLPDWLRDLVGVLKLTSALLLLVGIGRERLAMAGGLLLVILMASAIGTHVRCKTPLQARLPALSLFVLSTVILLLNYRIAYP